MKILRFELNRAFKIRRGRTMLTLRIKTLTKYDLRMAQRQHVMPPGQNE
jgi:hypothetical protein